MLNNMKFKDKFIVVCVLYSILLTNFAVQTEDNSTKDDINPNSTPFTWEKLLSEQITFQDLLNKRTGEYQDTPQIQDFLVNFGKSLDHCNSKLEESAEISQHLIREYVRNLRGRTSLDDDNEDVISDDVLMAIDFEEEVASFSEEIMLGSHDSAHRVGIWSSLHDVLVSLTDACNELPITIAQSGHEDRNHHDEQVETILGQMIRAMTQWTQKWTIIISHLADDFIDNCVTVPGCENNLKIIVAIFSKSLERTKTMHLDHSDGINLHTIIGTTSFWDHLSGRNQMNDENSNSEGSDISSYFRTRLGSMAGIFGYFRSNHSNNNNEYLSAAGVEGDISEENIPLNDVQLLGETEASKGSEEFSVESDDEDNIRLQRLMAAAANVFRFPWKVQDTNKAVLSIVGDAAFRTVPPTFLSLALESELIQDSENKFDCKSVKLRNLMAHITPIVFRLGGSSANFLTFEPSSQNAAEKIPFSNPNHNSYRHVSVIPRKSPFAPFYSERYFNGRRYQYVNTEKLYYSYIPDENEINQVPHNHPKYRQFQNDLKQLNAKETKRIRSLQSMKSSPKHPKFRKEWKISDSLEDNLYETEVNSVSGAVKRSIPHNTESLPNKKNIFNEHISAPFDNKNTNKLMDQQRRFPDSVESPTKSLARKTRSINANHPKFRRHQNSLQSRNYDALRQELRGYRNEPEYYNYTIGETELSDMLDLCSSLNWTLLFDLNQFYREVEGGRWDTSNARQIIQFAKERSADVIWQVGNEPNSYAHKYSFSITGAEMADDVTQLRQEVQGQSVFWQRLKEELGLGHDSNIQVVGPDVTRPKNDADDAAVERVGADSVQFLQEFLAVQPGLVDAVTWHQYYVSGKTATVEQFTSPDVMQLFVQQLDIIRGVRDTLAPGTPIWITETGSAYGGGAPGLSNRFVGSFLWLDKLGVAARDGVDVVARQSLYGRDYAMLDNDYNPNPDYWVSVLHKQLLGGSVLAVDLEGAPDTVRLYAHCINHQHQLYQPGGLVVYGQNSGEEDVDVAIQFSAASAPVLQYLLTPALGDLTAKDVLLNGFPLESADDGTIPPLKPKTITADQFSVPSYSLAFWVFPQANHTACL